MAASTTSACMAAVVAPSLAVSSTSTKRTSSSKVAMRKLKNFGGLRPDCQVTRMGLAPVSTEEAFAAVKTQCSGRVARGGALAANMDAASEIFLVVPIISALTLIGVAVGFVLLRVEAALEEAEE